MSLYCPYYSGFILGIWHSHLFKPEIQQLRDDLEHLNHHKRRPWAKGSFKGAFPREVILIKTLVLEPMKENQVHDPIKIISILMSIRKRVKKNVCYFYDIVAHWASERRRLSIHFWSLYKMGRVLEKSGERRRWHRQKCDRNSRGLQKGILGGSSREKQSLLC